MAERFFRRGTEILRIEDPNFIRQKCSRCKDPLPYPELMKHAQLIRKHYTCKCGKRYHSVTPHIDPEGRFWHPDDEDITRGGPVKGTEACKEKECRHGKQHHILKEQLNPKGKLVKVLSCSKCKCMDFVES